MSEQSGHSRRWPCAAAMTLCLNRHMVQAHNRVREGNYTLNGLVGAVLYITDRGREQTYFGICLPRQRQ
jgi:lactate dehydrogenase-like 2-hydroxyacid dehydrogenase